MHDISLLTTVAAAFTAAWVLGILTQRLGLSPIVGYLVAGVAIGPHTPGFAGDTHVAQQLAEVGVILLMFGVGLHFHVRDLLAVRGVAIPGAIGQSVVATLVAALLFAALGTSFATGAVIGMALAVASTVVLMRVLLDAHALQTPAGHIAVGWLLVEDVLTVVVLVLIPILGARTPDETGDRLGAGAALGLALLKLGALVAIVLLAGSRLIPWVLVQVARLRSRELFTLTVLVVAIAIAVGAYVFFGASMALGAFLAGMVVAQSPVSHQAAADALPLRDAFAVLFFVSVGMLFDPSFVLQQPLMVVAVLAVVLIVKPLAALAIVALLGHSVHTGLTVAIGLAQIGEFSFILSELARQHGLMPDAGHHALVAGAILSITLNPLAFRTLAPLEAFLRRQPRLWAWLNGRAERRARAANTPVDRAAGERATAAHAIIVGYGPVGRAVDRLLREAGLSTVVIDLNMDTVSEIQRAGQRAIFGDASHESILDLAGARRAAYFILTVPQAASRVAIVLKARELNPETRVLVRARYLRERDDLEHAGAAGVVFEEAEAAVALARLVLADTGAHREVVHRSVRDLQVRLVLENTAAIRSQTARDAMTPWDRVQRLDVNLTRDEALRAIAARRTSRWPVVDPERVEPLGYVEACELLAGAAHDADWTHSIRPLPSVAPDADLASTLQQMQYDACPIRAVVEHDRPIGILTAQDILQQAIGRLKHEPTAARELPLSAALAAGGVVLDLAARTAHEAITELASAVAPQRLPPDADLAGRAIARERLVSTDVGDGVAIPHARCPSLDKPRIVFGRSAAGIEFRPDAVEPVRLVFLLVSPAEDPDLQVRLLGRIAQLASDATLRQRLLDATSPEQVLQTVAEADAVATT
ncbi:MAG: cation:proton antiporter [Phycisphaerae bacterium]